MSDSNAPSAALARMQALRAKVEVSGQRRTVVQSATGETVQNAPQHPINIQNNPIFKIMEDDKKSINLKIRDVAQYLSAENEDYQTARARFSEFAIYFASVQGESVELYKEGIRKLIAEVRGAMKPEVEKIVKNITAVSEGTDELRRLIQVMRTARIEGTTVEQLTAAVKLNETIKGQIDSLEESLKGLQAGLPPKEREVATATDAKIESEGFWRTVGRLGRADKIAIENLQQALDALARMKQEVENTQTALKEKTIERNTKLESGELVILRTMDAKDATDNGFTVKISDTAEHDLEVIQNTQGSVAVLFRNLLARKEEAAHITTSISAEKVREAILKGALERAAKTAHERSEEIDIRLKAKDKDIEGATDEVDRAALTAERVGIAETLGAALRYEEAIKQTNQNFEVVASNTINSENEAKTLAGLLQATENMLNQIHTEALPDATRALHISLTEGMAVRDAGLTYSVGQLIDKVREIAKEGFANLSETKKEIRVAELQHWNKVLEALGQATDDVVTEAGLMVEHAEKKSVLAEKLGGAMKGLQAVMEEFDNLAANTTGAPSGTADAVVHGTYGGSGPSRPGSTAPSAPPPTPGFGGGAS